MKKCGQCLIEKSKEEFSKCASHNDGLSSICKTCAAEYGKSWRSRNIEKVRRDKKSYEEKNLVRIRGKKAEWKRKNYHEKLKPKNQIYNKKNAEKISKQGKARELINKEKRTETNKIWAVKNKAKLNHKCRLRQLLKKQATPPWANLKLIQEMYELSEMYSKNTGIKHHVDHVVPIQGKNVCGLHVHYNLQVMPYYENLSKGNNHV